MAPSIVQLLPRRLDNKCICIYIVDSPLPVHYTDSIYYECCSFVCLLVYHKISRKNFVANSP
jgi:hypothetical protein